MNRVLQLQKQKGKQPTKHTQSAAEAAENVPKIDNIEYVGTFMQRYGKLSAVIQAGQLTLLRFE